MKALRAQIGACPGPDAIITSGAQRCFIGRRLLEDIEKCTAMATKKPPIETAAAAGKESQMVEPVETMEGEVTAVEDMTEALAAEGIDLRDEEE